jgi:pimeloyl-ACP methyl ester carboxylesterase
VPALRRALLAAAAVAAALVVVLAAAYGLSWRFRNSVGILLRIGPQNLSIAYPDPGEPVRFASGDLRLAGSLLRPPGAGGRPGILLLHGSSPLGRKLALYRMLAARLAERGYVVLSIDLRGYGDSDDPTRLDRLEALDSRADVHSAVGYLERLPFVDPGRIHLLGHSYGAGVAIGAAPEEPRIRKLVAIGPPRRTLERFGKEAEAFRTRYSHDRRLSRLVPPEVFGDLVRATAIDAFIPFFASDRHPPILLLDGALEDADDRAYLAGYAARLSPPKRYLTLADTAHYLNTVNIAGRRLVLYDDRVLSGAVDIIDAWLRAPD